MDDSLTLPFSRFHYHKREVTDFYFPFVLIKRPISSLTIAEQQMKAFVILSSSYSTYYEYRETDLYFPFTLIKQRTPFSHGQAERSSQEITREENGCPAVCLAGGTDLYMRQRYSALFKPCEILLPAATDRILTL